MVKLLRLPLFLPSLLSRLAIFLFLVAALAISPAIAGAEDADDEAGDKALPTVATMREALDLATGDGRLVFVELMAWKCPHCEAFAKQVLASNVFRAYAGESLHLVIYDIKRQSALTNEQRAEISELIKEHKVKFTPTILVFAADGSLLLSTTGYQGTPPEKIVEHLKGL